MAEQGELTHRGRDGTSPLWAGQTSDLFIRGPGLDAPGGAALPFQSVLVSMVILHVIMKQLGFTE